MSGSPYWCKADNEATRKCKEEQGKWDFEEEVAKGHDQHFCVPRCADCATRMMKSLDDTWPLSKEQCKFVEDLLKEDGMTETKLLDAYEEKYGFRHLITPVRGGREPSDRPPSLLWLLDKSRRNHELKDCGEPEKPILMTANDYVKYGHGDLGCYADLPESYIDEYNEQNGTKFKYKDLYELLDSTKEYHSDHGSKLAQQFIETRDVLRLKVAQAACWGCMPLYWTYKDQGRCIEEGGGTSKFPIPDWFWDEEEYHKHKQQLDDKYEKEKIRPSQTDHSAEELTEVLDKLKLK